MDKVCVNHPESPSVGACKACEKPVCLMCIVEVQGVSFCSEACGSAYQEVKDWLERPAADEEWNPLAEAKAKMDAESKPPPAPEPAATASAEPPGKSSPSGTEMRAALSTAFGENLTKPADPVPQVAAPEAPSSGGGHASLYIAVAATILIIIGIVVLFNSGNDKQPPAPTPEVARLDPPKPAPVLPPTPKPEPPKPKPEPVKVDPPKPEPPKPKPEPVKPEPPKPEVVKPEPPKPKPEPVKPEPPKPEVVKPEPPKPKPEPVKPEPPKPEIAKPEPPKPKPEPPPAPHLGFLRDPWGKEKPGAWYRIKTTTNGQDSYRDVGLRETGAGYRVLVSQNSAAGKTEPEQFTWTEPEELVPLGSVNGDAQGTKYAADVVRVRASRPSQYVFKDAPHAGASFASDAVLTRLGVDTLKVKDRSINCSLMETEAGTPKRAAKTWYSTQVPLGTVRTESDGSTSALVDFGDDWAKRPPFPELPVIAKVDPPKPVPVKPEPPKPEPAKPEPPKPEPLKPEPPKPEPPKPAPKPEPVKPEPPKPEPVKPPPPKPEPPKPEPPKPEPVKPEPPKPEPVKPEPPKPEPAKPEPPRKEEASTRVKKSLADAAGLIREATPIYLEIAGAMESIPTEKAALEDLVRKAERVQLKLGDAKVLYSNVKADAPDPLVLDRRLSQIDELLGSVSDCVRQLKRRLQ